MALDAFVLATLHCIAYCSLGKNCVCPAHPYMTQYNHRAVLAYFRYYRNNIDRQMREIAFTWHKKFTLRHVRHVSNITEM